MAHVRILKITKLPTEFKQATKQAQKQAYYQHDVATLIADHVLGAELLFTSIGYYRDTNKATRYLQLTLATSASPESVDRKLTQSTFNFHWTEPSAIEEPDMTNIFWKLLCCFPDGAPSVYTEGQHSFKRKASENVAQPVQNDGCTVILRYVNKHLSENDENSITEMLHTKYSADYGFNRMDRAFYDDGGFPSRIVKLYFGTPEQADTLRVKMLNTPDMDGLAQHFSSPTKADIEFVEGRGRHREQHVTRNDFGFVWKVQHLSRQSAT